MHENLRDHPDILWPREKEIFYFSRLKTPDHPKFVSADLDWYLAQFQDPLWLRAVKTALSFRSSQSLYRPRVRGEATASYAAMDRDVIEEIVALNPLIRAIMMIRNPIDRAWSHAKKDLVRNRGRRFEDVSEREFEEFFRDFFNRNRPEGGPQQPQQPQRPQRRGQSLGSGFKICYPHFRGVARPEES